MLIFAFAAPAALLVAFLLLKRHTPPHVYDRLQADISKRWRTLPFTPIEDSPGFFQKLKEIKGLTTSGLSQGQVADLQASLYSLMVGLKTGSYEAYRRFRTPIPAKFNPEALEVRRRQAIKDKITADDALPADDEEFIKLYISWANRWQGFTNCWLAVALDEAVVRVAERSTATNDLSAWAWSQDNLGIIVLYSVFRFDVTPERLLERHGKLLQVTVSMVVRPRPPDPECLVHFRFFWDEDSQHWIPWEYVQANSRGCGCRLLW